MSVQTKDYQSVQSLKDLNLKMSALLLKLSKVKEENAKEMLSITCCIFRARDRILSIEQGRSAAEDTLRRNFLDNIEQLNEY